MPKVRVTGAETGEDVEAGTGGEEVARNAEIVADKLRGKGVTVLESDSPDDLVNLLESVELFEQEVKNAGGDLMMDEPPPGRAPQPDDARFVLPARDTDEKAASYIGRLTDATTRVRNRED